MEELMSSSSVPRLDLNNFDSADEERSRNVLTTRSLQTCERLGIKPVELLIKSLNELISNQNEAEPFEAVRVMYESYEKERMKSLQMCLEERERIIQAGRDRWSGQVSGLEPLSGTKQRNHSVETTGSIPYADLCCKGKSVSRSSLSGVNNPLTDRSTVCSFSLGCLRPSPATQMKLEKVTENIKKEMCVTVSERDRKIAALMLVRHQEEQASQKLSQQEEQERQEARSREEAQWAQAEKVRRKKLKQSMQHWHEELRARRRLREQREKEKQAQLVQEVQMQEDRWRRWKEEVEAHRREKTEAAQIEAGGRKHCQEKLLREKEEVDKGKRERERQVALERELKAKRSKVLQEMKKRKRLEEVNRKELLQHILLRKHAEQQEEEEEAQMRSTLEKKLSHSSDKHTQASEARLRELRERAAQEEEQIQRAQLKAELRSIQQLTHKQILVQLSQRRMERAALHAETQQRTRAQQTYERNQHRQLCHLMLRERIQRREDAVRKVKEKCISMKECRRERLRRQREQIQEEAHRLAQASFHMRDRVRQETQSRTFRQMVVEAELTASVSRMKL